MGETNPSTMTSIQTMDASITGNEKWSVQPNELRTAVFSDVFYVCGFGV